TDAIVEFADRFCGGQRMEETLRGVNVVVLEIETLQPRILPRQTFGFAKRLEQPLLGDPVDTANEQLGLGAQRIECKCPARQDPIGLLVSSGEKALRVSEKCLLNIERIASSAIIEKNEAASGSLMRDLAGGHHCVAQDDVARQRPFFKERQDQHGGSKLQ